MKYSVIIPTYNYGRYIEGCIKSVFSQTIKPYEVIVVNDGSTDDTESVLKNLNRKFNFKHIKIKNSGVSAARNEGIVNSTCEFIAFLDSDDIWYPEKMELQLPLLKDKRIGVVYALRTLINEKLEVVKDRPYSGEYYRGDVLQKLLIRNLLGPSATVIRRDCLEDVGYFNTNFSQGEDYDLWLRISAKGYFFDFINKPLVYRRVDGDASKKELWELRYRSNKLILQTLFNSEKYQSRITKNMRQKGLASLHQSHGNFLYLQGERVRGILSLLTSLYYDLLNMRTWILLFKCFLPFKIQKVILGSIIEVAEKSCNNYSDTVS